MRPFHALACIACAVTIAGCRPDAVAFQATTLLAATAGSAQNLNDEIAIRFSQELDPGSVSLDSLRVTDESGRRLPIRVRSVNDVLLIAPADPDGWPADSRLAVEVPHPWLGRPIRSANGAANGAAFRAEVQTGRRYASRGGALRLTYHSLPFSGGTDVTPNAEFLFELDGTLDPATIRDSVLLEDLTWGESPTPVPAEAITPRRLSVKPFDGHEFHPAARYRLTLAASLASQDTRRLGAPLSFIFTTTSSHSGEHATDFRPEHLVIPALKGDRKGPLVPQLAPFQAPWTVAGPAFRGEPFGPAHSRVQILIPMERLPQSAGPNGEPVYGALITAVSFKVQGPPSSLRLSARLDYAASSHARELGRSFEENWSLPSSRPRDLLGPECEVYPLIIGDDGILTLRFAKPFFYEASRSADERALVLEIVNDSGVLNDSPGILLLGKDDPAAGPVFLFARGEGSGESERLSFVPEMALWVNTGCSVVELKPWTTTSVTNPEYFRRADDVVATPGFVGYKVQYRSLDAIPGQQPVDWTENVSILNGHRTIQARVIFLLRSADPLPKDAGLLRLAVPFRERGE